MIDGYLAGSVVIRFGLLEDYCVASGEGRWKEDRLRPRIFQEQKQKDRAKSPVSGARRGLYFSPAPSLPATWPWALHLSELLFPLL